MYVDFRAVLVYNTLLCMLFFFLCLAVLYPELRMYVVVQLTNLNHPHDEVVVCQRDFVSRRTQPNTNKAEYKPKIHCYFTHPGVRRH